MASLSQQIEAISALLSMIDAGTPTGEAVLAAVERDLTATYEKLATYVKKISAREA